MPTFSKSSKDKLAGYRKCSGCREEFPETEDFFYFGKSIGYYRSFCKECEKEKNKEYKYKNREKILEYQKEYRTINKEKETKRRREYRINNREKHNKYKREYDKNKYKLDINFKLNACIRGGIYRSLNGQKNGYHWESLVNYTQEDLRRHIEAKFKEGMSWQNYGKKGWEIDHKIPISLFNIKGIKSKGFKKCWALENLQPMWEKENTAKKDKLFY